MKVPKLPKLQRTADPFEIQTERTARRERGGGLVTEIAIKAFTELPAALLREALGGLNFTPIDVSMLKTVSKNKDDDSEDRARLAAARRQLQYLIAESDSSRQHLAQKEQRRLEAQREASEQPQQESQPAPEPSTRRRRGELGVKRAKTAENKPSFGKQ